MISGFLLLMHCKYMNNLIYTLLQEWSQGRNGNNGKKAKAPAFSAKRRIRQGG